MMINCGAGGLMRCNAPLAPSAIAMSNQTNPATTNLIIEIEPFLRELFDHLNAALRWKLAQHLRIDARRSQLEII